MKIKLVIFSGLFLCLTSFPIEAFYLGGQVGNVALTGRAKSLYSNTIGFALDLGFRTNPLLDVMLSSQYSSHSGGANGLSVYAETLGANFHVLEANDFDFSLGAGPGFYFFKHDNITDTMFGIHAGGNVDVKASDNLRVGIGLRYHTVFRKDSDIGDNLWTIMMRVGYQFGA